MIVVQLDQTSTTSHRAIVKMFPPLFKGIGEYFVSLIIEVVVQLATRHISFQRYKILIYYREIQH